MAQLSNDCFAADGRLLGLEEARALVLERLDPVAATEQVPLAAAQGRVLVADLRAPISLPPFDNSAVDGYAVRFDDLRRDAESLLPVVTRVAAGSVPAGVVGGGAVRIFTGAPMPDGFDTVFMQEDVAVAEGEATLPPGLARGANRRLAGEDVAQGAPALAAGRRLRPQDLGLLAALGLDRVEVRRPLRVAVFSTGAELVAPGRPLAGAKLYDANRFMLLGALARLGCAATDLGILADDPAAIEAALRGAADHDLLLTSGGVSMGEEDHVRAAVERAGHLHLWRVALKPGRPVAMGVVAGTPFLGLPGNPVAVYVTFALLARAVIARLGGEDYAAPQPFTVRAGFAYRKKGGRREYVRATLRPAPGGPEAVKHPREGAGILTSLTESDGLVELPEAVREVAPGDPVGFLPYAVLI